MKYVLALLVCVASAQSLMAKEESKTFEQPTGVVYEAALEVAKQDGVVIYSDKDHLTLTFKSGGYWNKGFEVAVQIEKADDNKSRVTLRVQKTYFGAGWGAAKRITRDFFRDLESKLKK
jgi:hypothetical protein